MGIQREPCYGNTRSRADRLLETSRLGQRTRLMGSLSVSAPVMRSCAVGTRCRRIANNESCTHSNLVEDFRQDLARVDVPTLVIHRGDDRLLPFSVAGQRTAPLVKGAQLVVIKGGPHYVTWTKTGETKAALLNFLGYKRRGRLIGTELSDGAPKERSGIANDRSPASNDRMFKISRRQDREQRLRTSDTTSTGGAIRNADARVSCNRGAPECFGSFHGAGG